MKKLLVISIVFLFFGMIIYPSSGIQIQNYPTTKSNRGNTLYVGGNGPGNYTSIQDAIDNSSDNDTVFVYDDSSPYYENILINNTINLIGENKETTIIDGKESGDVVHVSADWVNISNFRIIKSCSNYKDNGIEIASNYTTITGNYISADECNTGILLQNSNNTIKNNTFENNWYGILIENTNNNYIFNNIFKFNINDGIKIRNSNYNIIKNNNFNSTEYYYGIELDNAYFNNISNNLFLKNIWGGIEIRKSHNNYISNNKFEKDGIEIYKSFKNTVKNNSINGKPLVYYEDESNKLIDVDAGQIILINCNNFTIQNQEISNTKNGIALWNSSNCYLSDNILSYCISSGIDIYSSSNNILTNNTLIGNCYGTQLLYSDNHTIFNNTFNGNNNGLNIGMSSYNIVKKNTLSYDGIDVGPDSFNNIISENIIYYGETFGIGIEVGYTNNNLINGNLLNKCCIIIDDSNYNKIINNNIQDCREYYSPIWIRWSNNNTIVGNNITDSPEGIYLCWSYYNIFYHNNLINNTQNVYEKECSNIWDNGYPSGGNYWDDYNGTDEDGDGIGDTPYPIPGGNNEDRYPLMYPIVNFPPATPIVFGPRKGTYKVAYKYILNSTDQNNDPIMYYIDWGDNTTDCTEFNDSGEEITIKHTWTSQGNFTIKAQAIDIKGAKSDWYKFTVTMPRDKSISSSPLLSFLERYPLIQYILQRFGL